MVLLLASRLNAQEDSITKVATDHIFKIAETASWLMRYERVAWVSSDSVITQPDSLKARLGPDWFIDTTATLWHAFYGRYEPDSDTYSITFHYTGDKPSALRSSTVPVDTARLTATARALHNSRIRLPSAFTPHALRLNWYVRRPTVDTIEVWFLPAYQPTGLLVFGGEAVYRWDSAGRQLLDSTYSLATFLSVRPDSTKEIVLPADEFDYPSPGNLYLLLNYHTAFRHLIVRNRRVLTSVWVGPEGPSFVTAVRDAAPH
jgi:hypothetical protein